MGEEFTLEDLLIVVRRRALYFLGPAVAATILGIAVVMLLPSRYAAQGTILVESAQIPSELVRSTVNAYAQERIQMIRQRVMTRERLLRIADKYALFPKDLRLSESERVRRMKSRMKIELITAGDARIAGQRDNTIAFTLSYADPSPEKAYQVANEFMSLFLTEDVRTRTAGASNTTEFFKGETARLAGAVDAVEERIAQYKSENADALPEHLDMHLAALERAQRDLGAAETSIDTLGEEQRFLETQLASYFAGAANDNGPASELARRKSELAQLRAVYRDAHPNVQALKDQIRALEGQLAPSKDIQDLQAAMIKAETDLKTAQRSGADGATVAERRAALAAAQQTLSERIAKEAASGNQDFLSAQIMGRISIANSRRELLEEGAEATRKTIAALQAQIARTPDVERGLQALQRNRDNLFRQYQEVLAKQQDAQLAENLEDDQKAERFSILEPAQRPDKATSPERAKLSVLALFVALALGGGVALAAELLFNPVRGRHHLERLLGAAPLAVIPNFARDNERRALWPFRRRASAAAAPEFPVAGATPESAV